MKNFGLSANERIKKAKDFRKIYLDGKIVYSEDRKLKVTFLIESNQEEPIVKIVAAVSKKAGKAVWRNRIRRLIKESYRLNKHEFLEACKEKKSSLFLVFTPLGYSRLVNKKIKLSEIMPGVIDILIKLKSGL